MTSLRPFGFDELGLRRGVSDRMLPVLVAAMAFLAALALAGWFGAAALSRHWREGANATLTVQVPQAEAAAAAGDGNRLAAVLAVLRTTPGVAAAHALSERELVDLLRPWLGDNGIGDNGRGGAEHLALPIPAVIAVRLNDAPFDAAPLTHRLEVAVPGTLVEDHGIWIGRLTVLARSLQACAAMAVLLVALVAAAVVAIATRAGLATLRQTIEIVYGLGAADGYIAGRFAARTTRLATIGAASGGLVALPILLALAGLAAPFGDVPAADGNMAWNAVATLPVALWLALPFLPVAAAAIGFVTTQWTVRRWLRRLP